MWLHISDGCYGDQKYVCVRREKLQAYKSVGAGGARSVVFTCGPLCKSEVLETTESNSDEVRPSPLLDVCACGLWTTVCPPHHRIC